DAAKQILGGLKESGFQAPATASKDFGTQFTNALKQFQQAQGLPANGKLDGATSDALKNLGLAGAPPQAEKPDTAAARDNFDRGASLLKQGERSRADVAKNASPDTNFLDALLNKLGGDQGVTSDRAGQVGGTGETATNAQKSSDAKDVKKASETDKAGNTEAKKSSKDDVNQPLDKNAREASRLQVARGLKSDTTKTEEQRRKPALYGKDPTERGILDDEAEDDVGDGGDGNKRGKGGDQQAGGHDAAGTDTGGGVGERDGDEKHSGNASSGDENHGDPKRGHASIDDGSDDGAGHYRVPTLSEQAFSALEKIKKDDTANNRATTYSWDVTFFKPGVYGAGQKAQELVHLVVQSSTAFDPVWQRAQANLQVMVRRLERDGAVPSHDDIIGALRQARARDGDSSAAVLAPFKRPPGRA
ncbi:MAG TPA: peptidoglycan-binding protein, partial [Myxococcota bacterium]